VKEVTPAVHFFLSKGLNPNKTSVCKGEERRRRGREKGEGRREGVRKKGEKGGRTE
jgi:hypothetical protein